MSPSELPDGAVRGRTISRWLDLDVPGKLSDETWFRNRLAAIRTNLGLTLAQLQKAIDFRKVAPREADANGTETKAEVTPLPSDWVKPSPQAQSVTKPDRLTAPK